MLNYLWIYLAGFVAVQVLTWLSLRSEPTAHGHIVGTQMGCLIGLFWPLAVPYLAVMFAYAKLTGKFDA